MNRSVHNASRVVAILIVSLLALANTAAVRAQSTAPHQPLGRKIYHQYCYYCHGHAGDGQTTAGAYLAPPPRNFTQLELRRIDRQRMARIVAAGSPATAMQAFESILTTSEIEAVVDFIIAEFVVARARGTRYHAQAGGWSSGFTAQEVNAAKLDAQRDVVCLTCHEAGGNPEAREARPLDAVSAASPYAIHDRAPTLRDPSPQVIAGGELFQANCAFCHARDGSGRNWIGNFLEPHARDLRSPTVCNAPKLTSLPTIIEQGLPGTSMPAWRDVLTREQIVAISTYVEHAFCRSMGTATRAP